MYQVRNTVPAAVLDVGSHTVKAGIAGEDLPHLLLPSQLALKAGADGNAAYDSPPIATQASTRRRDGVQVQSAFGPDGLVSNWHHFEVLLSHTLHHELGMEQPTHALLYAEPNFNGRAAREKLAELLFEKYNLPAIYLARSAVLAAYANGRTTGVVLDIGHSGSSAVSVIEGAISKERIIRTPIGGRALRQTMDALLQKRNIQLRPLWSFKSKVVRSEDSDMILDRQFAPLTTPNVTTSFAEFARTSILDEVTACVARARDSPGQPQQLLPSASPPYELPDGQTIELGQEAYLAAETTLFGKLPHVTASSMGGDSRPTHVAALAAQLGAAGGGGPGSLVAASDGLHGLVIDAIRKVDHQLHRDMYAGVCLTGGSSNMGGLFERLSVGLMERYPKVRVLAATGAHERKYCTWTGGSILATFSEFQKMWFSKSEYDENGVAFVHRKCP